MLFPSVTYACDNVSARSVPAASPLDKVRGSPNCRSTRTMRIDPEGLVTANGFDCFNYCVGALVVRVLLLVDATWDGGACFVHMLCSLQSLPDTLCRFPLRCMQSKPLPACCEPDVQRGTLQLC